MGAFSNKFSMAPSDETTDRIKKSYTDEKMGRTSSITTVGILGRAPAVDEKAWFFCLSVFITLWNDEVCDTVTETLWSSISFKTIMMSLHRGRFVVVHRCSSFPIDPKNFSRWAHFYQKLQFLAIFGAIRPHFNATTVKFGMRVRSWGFLPQAKFCKNDLRGYTPLDKIYTKNYHFWRFFGP